MALSMVDASNFDDGQDAVGTDIVAEIQNILGNALQLISPVTANLDMGGNKITTLSLGSAIASPLSPIGNTATGVYFPNANTMAIAADGKISALFNTATSGVNYLVFTPAASGTGPIIDVD